MTPSYLRQEFRPLWAAAALALASAVTALAAETKAPAPLMTEPADSLVNDKFATELPKPWRGAMGKWTCEDGALRGIEVAANKHQAVLRRPLAFTNAIITFSFRLDAAKQISLSVNDAKEHVCRVIINPRGFVVQKDDHDHDGPDKAVVFARVPMALAPGEWHTAVVEINGPEMVAQIDSAAKVGFGSHELLDHPKANFGFTVAGGPAEFRDVTVTAAKPRADWVETKKRLSAK
jgi:predicted ATPase